jgi:excisionase family DNA binding protein
MPDEIRDPAEAPGGAANLITLAEAADRLKVSVRTVRRLIRYGYLPGYRVGPRVLRVHADDVETVVRRIPEGYDDEALD